MNQTNDIYKLSDLAEIRSGFAFKAAIKKSPTGGIPVIQIKDVTLGHVIPWQKLTCVKEVPLMSGNLLKRDMILFSAKGTKNFAWHINIEPPTSICTSLFHIIAPNTTLVDPAFLTWQINQAKAQAYLDQTSAGDTVKNIKISSFKALPITVPPMEIQKKVAKYAQAAFNEKKVLTQLIDNRDKEMRAIAANILTGQI